MSDRTAKESGRLVDDSSQPIDLASLYVDRDIESRILREVQTEPGCTVLAGEGGSGKTSLLWHIHQHFQHTDIPAIFLRADMAALFDLDQLCLALLKTPRPVHGYPVLLIDTADAIAWKDDLRDKLLDIIDSTSDLGYSTIVSSRISEADRYLSGYNYNRITVPDQYSEPEFWQIIETHVKHFYQLSDPGPIDKRIEDLRTIVSQGKPVAALATHPLLLRMLFFLYAPHEIPPEISTALLYGEYWYRKVETDWRAGRSVPESGAGDHAQSTLEIAYKMVDEGTTRLTKDETRTLLNAAKGCKQTDVDHLISRGVLRRSSAASESDSIEFFHQTFFEYGAAKSLINRYKAQGIDLLVRRLRDYPHDQFRFPIVEQSLLLSQSAMNDQIKLRGQEHIEQILTYGPSHLQRAAVVAYAQMRQVPQCLRDAFSACLEDPELAVAFVRSTPTTPPERLAEVWEHFNQVWAEEATAINRQNPWSAREAILDQLPRFAHRMNTSSSIDFAAFMLDHDVIQPGKFELKMVRRVVAVLSALVEYQPAKSLDLLERLFEWLKSNHPTNKSGISSVALAIARHPNVSSARLQEIADGLSSYTEGFVLRAGGVVRAELWYRNGLPIGDILDLTSSVGAYELSALAAWLSRQTDESWDQAWEHFASLVEVSACREWVWHVWDRLGKDPLDSPDMPSIRASKYLSARVASAIQSASPAERSAGLRVCRYSRNFRLRVATLQATLERCAEPLSVADFCAADALGLLLGPAIAIEVPGALEAILPQSVLHKEVKQRLLEDVKPLVTYSPNRVYEIALFLIRCGEFNRIDAAIHEGGVAGGVNLRALPEDVAAKLMADIMRVLTLPSAQKRQQGARWAYRGLAQKMGITLEFDRLLEFAKSETDGKVIAWLTMALYRLAESPEQIDTALTMALSIATEGDEHMRDDVLEDLFEWVIDERRLKYLDSLFDAVERNFNRRTIRAVARTVPRITAINRDKASALVHRILLHSSLHASSNALLNSFRRRVRKPLIQWGQQADLKDLLLLVDALPLMHETVGELTLEIVYHRRHGAPLRAAIERLDSNPSISTKIKRFILELLYKRDSAIGVGYWGLPAESASRPTIV